ncbi:SDR family oxidoreductase [Streptomyces sp. NBC_00237]|uniref:SDR family oxidoreductase n=1 Tax=Streptomyces sp. NBC_00237 TaxID=2975687 RepID=UPI002257A79D|nr:SDR family oxidoreductase [Streptomyces sp. NBC_00237]MCX5201138.1 SDR family oxidoreductase [Streptomyces sp. NBC_00237]
MPRPITLITGGSRGIGAAACHRLAADGHDIALTYVQDEPAAEETAEAVRATGARCLVVQADTSHEPDVDRLFDTVAAELGPLTNLVNNAGVTGKLTSLADAPTDDLRRVLDVNVLGTLLCCRRAVRDMTAHHTRGAIVNVSSGAATIGSPGEYVHYAASKAAVDTITLGLSKELGPDGIRVNGVAPGLTDTDMHVTMGDPDRPARMAPAIPLRRAAAPSEIAAGIAWLLSADASYTTGTVLRIAGGR